MDRVRKKLKITFIINIISLLLVFLFLFLPTLHFSKGSKETGKIYTSASCFNLLSDESKQIIYLEYSDEEAIAFSTQSAIGAIFDIEGTDEVIPWIAASGTILIIFLVLFCCLTIYHIVMFIRDIRGAFGTFAMKAINRLVYNISLIFSVYLIINYVYVLSLRVMIASPLFYELNPWVPILVCLVQIILLVTSTLIARSEFELME